ncbi:thialysine N-epsilon-acetyltransferase-like [Vanessa tameamea]|uniref:Thialysine N-epsilon-acetyltransferase-like n=1 Tax=Vanessa tameamea TaxID=334116 RepID=A0A8B8HJA1_VANTA|nr:diamine acetyltransferase 2-like [Vanessa tameamea]
MSALTAEVVAPEATGRADAEQIQVRMMRREDAAAVHEMIHELATFEGVPDGPKLSEQDLIEDGFESSPSWFFGLVAEKDGRMVGHAMCNRAYSSWTRRAFYIEDLYVRPTARRGGVARRLLQELCRIAVAEGVHRVDWHVLENNADALAFYSRLGARDLRVTEGRAALRLDRPRIEAVAGGHLLSAVKDEAVEPALNS